MKDVAIVESGKEFKFSGTGKLETELQNGGSCYWVPKEERETGHIFASENREYTPDEISKYGISSVDVNIVFTGITDGGEPWSVTIDTDTELPIIDIDGIEITIDDIGDIDIHIPGGDPDDWPGWDDLDPGIKADFDDWINNGGDPDDWPGWDDLDPSIKDNFDDWISDIDTSIDDSMLEDMGIDIDDNIDISVDDLGNIDISNGDISVNLDPITGEWDTGECPTSIKIMHVPNKTEYTDGEAIDYDGLVVQAFDKDGNPWSSKKYPDGYIPAHELSLPKYAEYTTDEMWYHATSDLIEDGINYTTSVTITIVDKDDKSFPWTFSTSGEAYIIIDKGYINQRYAYAISSKNGRSSFTHDGKTVYYSETSGFIHYAPIVSPEAESFANIGYAAWTTLYGESEPMPLDSSVPVVWNSPCFVQLETKFQINVTQREDHGGSHHSGKF